MRKLKKKMQRQNCISRDICVVSIDCKKCDGTIQNARSIKRAELDKKMMDKLFPDD